LVHSPRPRAASKNGQYAFQTPLGTNHLFQGWADQFLTTPREGLRDTSLMASGKIGKAQLLAEYHRFKSDFGSIDCGDEIDFGVAYPFLKQLTGRFEYAAYQAGDASAGKRDITKIWLTLIFNYRWARGGRFSRHRLAASCLNEERFSKGTVGTKAAHPT
jgi:hypothetical protein